MNIALILFSLSDPITRGDVGMFFLTMFTLFAIALVGFFLVIRRL